MRIRLITVGRPSRSGLGEPAREYAERLGRFVTFSEQAVKAAPSSLSDMEIRRRESAALQSAVPKGAWVVALDEGGEQPSSTVLARRLERERDSGRQEAAFLVGGAVGHDPSLVAQADWVLSLSRLTLPHEMARLVLLEQLYRACTIMAGLPYHKA